MGRVTFEKEVRAGRSAAIVEHVKGNNFKFRVYPIPASGTKRVSLTYTHVPIPNENGDGTQLVLPFLFNDTLKELKIDVGVHSLETGSTSPSVPNAPMGMDFKFSKHTDLWSAHEEATDVQLLSRLIVNIPNNSEMTEAVYV